MLIASIVVPYIVTALVLTLGTFSIFVVADSIAR
jgi:hypothetical protein